MAYHLGRNKKANFLIDQYVVVLLDQIRSYRCGSPVYCSKRERKHFVREKSVISHNTGTSSHCSC